MLSVVCRLVVPAGTIIPQNGDFINQSAFSDKAIALIFCQIFNMV
jgi:hypothetical protein